MKRNIAALCVSIALLLCFVGMASNMYGQEIDFSEEVAKTVYADTAVVYTTRHIVDGEPSPSQTVNEGEKKSVSHFPEHPEQYIPMPIPEWKEPKGIPAPRNQVISFDIRTGKEVITEIYPKDNLESDYVKGSSGLLQDRSFNKLEDGEPISPRNFSDLQMISNPEDYPWRVNCKLYLSFSGGNYVASGVLIDGLHVLTAGHCVYSHDHGGWANSITVVPGYENGTTPYGAATSVQLHSFTGWTQNQDYNHDMGVIDLDRPIGALTGWHGYGYNNSDSFFTDNTFNNPGYPAESPYNGEYLYYWYGFYDEVSTYLLYIHKLSYGGQSGSGSYFSESDSRYVYAEHSHKHRDWPWSDWEAGQVRMTSSKFTAIRDDIISPDTPTSFDLWALDVNTTPSTITAGNALASMNYVVHNYSSASWSGTVEVDVYLSTNDDISTADRLIQTHYFTHSFGPKSSVRLNVSTPPTIPGDVTEDDYWIGAILDISDDDTGNNDTDGQDASPIHINPASPLLYVNPTDIDLGTHLAGYGFSSSFIVRNDGGQTLTGTVSESASWITSLSPTSFSRTAGQQTTINFSGSFPSTSGPFSTNISVTSNGGSQNVSVHGVVQEPDPVLYVNPTDIDLGTHLAGYGFASSFIVRNDGGGTLSGTVSESVSWITSLSPTSFSRTSGQQTTISFSGSFPSTSGSFSTNISVTSNGGSENVHVHGVVQEPSPVLYVHPTDIDLGTHLAGYGFASSFIVRNDGGQTLSGTVSESVSWITSLSPTSFSRTAGQQTTINFSGSFPSTPGSFSTNISVTSNGGSENVYVHGVVQEPASVLYVHPTDIDLGTHLAGYGFSSSFVVRNDGGGTLTGNVSESASWITSLSPTSFNLSAGQQTTISFSGSFPSTLGSFSTNISVTSNGGNQNIYVHGVVEQSPGQINFSWQYKASMPEARVGSAVAVYNNRIHVIGGNYMLSHYRYDSSTNSWAAMASPPGNGIAEGGAAVVGTKIYAVHNQFDEQMRIYDPGVDSWTTGASMPTSRRGSAVVAVNGKVYAIGGTDSNLNGFNTVEMYDPTMDSWSTKAPMPSARGFAAAAVVNGLVYVIGGRSDNSSPQIKSTVEVYNSSTNIWTSKNSMPTRRLGAAVGVLGNKIYVIGGFDGSNYLNTVEEYDPATDSWRTLSPILAARHAAVAGVVNDKIYVIGGSNESGSLSSTEEGTPTTTPILYVAPTDIDLGTHLAGYGFSSSFVVRNDGGGTLSGTVSESASWITSLSPTSFSRTAGQQTTINFSGSFPSTPGSFSTNISVTSNGGSQNVSVHGEVTPAAEFKWTFLVYLDGDNNLEGAGIDDFLEMATVGSDADVNIVVLFDRIAGYDAGYDDWTDTRRGLINLGDVPNTSWGESIDEANMGDPQTLIDFVEWGMQNYPASNYAVVLWDHGDGWRRALAEGTILKSVCSDNTDGDQLFMQEVRNALATIETDVQEPDLVGFDACLMGMVEVAYEIRQHASVMVGSEEIEPGDGWPYDTVLADLVTDPSMSPADLGSTIVSRYYAFYNNSETQSAIDLASMDALATEIDALAQTLRDDWTSDTDACVAAANDVMTAINSAVIAEEHGVSWPGSHGLAIYFPETSGQFNPDYNGSVILFPGDTRWEEFLQDFYASMSGSWVANARVQSQEYYTPQHIDLYDFCAKLIDNASCEIAKLAFTTDIEQVYAEEI